MPRGVADRRSDPRAAAGDDDAANVIACGARVALPCEHSAKRRGAWGPGATGPQVAPKAKGRKATSPADQRSRRGRRWQRGADRSTKKQEARSTKREKDRALTRGFAAALSQFWARASSHPGRAEGESSKGDAAGRPKKSKSPRGRRSRPPGLGEGFPRREERRRTGQAVDSPVRAGERDGSTLRGVFVDRPESQASRGTHPPHAPRWRRCLRRREPVCSSTTGVPKGPR